MKRFAILPYRMILIISLCLFHSLLPFNTSAQEYIGWKQNFGGASSLGGMEFLSVAAVPGGIVAAGYVLKPSFSAGDWEGIPGKGGADAIIVKYDHNGNVVWKKNFGGENHDLFNSVTTVADGVIAVGYSNKYSFGTGDWEGVANKGTNDAIIVKYGHDGNVVWKKNFGGSGSNIFRSVARVPDGVVAVGCGSFTFDAGDWEAIPGKGDMDAIIVKFDHAGNIVWKKNFGGENYDEYYAVAAVADGVTVVGYSNKYSFETGDWEGVAWKGEAMIIKYDHDGNVVWKKAFGGTGANSENAYIAVTAAPDGIVAIGYAYYNSFGTGDWEGIVGKGRIDAIIVKYDYAGSVVWKRNFGGTGTDWFTGIVAVSGGVVIVGSGTSDTFGTGDWEAIPGKGDSDALIVKYDHDGNRVWEQNFGGMGADYYCAVARVADSIYAVGGAEAYSFGNGDWEGIGAKGDMSAIIIKYITDSTANIIEPEPGKLLAYPNPATGEVRVTGSGWQPGRPGEVKVLDIMGRAQSHIPQRYENETIVADLSRLPPGIYFLQTEGKTVKIIKQ